MTATARSPLEALRPAIAVAGERSGGAAVLRELPFLGQLDLRVEEAGRRAVEEGLGIELPSTPNRWRAGDPEAYWLGPDEWLLVEEADSAATLERRARVTLDSSWGAAVDVSDQRLGLELSGSAAAEVLAGGCSIDLHRRSFDEGACAQTLLGRAGVLIARRGPSSFRIFVRTTFAGYLTAWLLDAIEALPRA